MKTFLIAATCATLLAAPVSAATVDAFNLDVGNPLGTNSGVVLALGQSYEVTVSGTFQIAFPDVRIADAEYYFRNGIPTDIRPETGEDIGVAINGVGVNWGPYNALNIYKTIVIGTGSTFNFLFVDIPGGYSDNVGSLRVTISEVPLPASGLLLLGALAALRLRRRAA